MTADQILDAQRLALIDAAARWTALPLTTRRQMIRRALPGATWAGLRLTMERPVEQMSQIQLESLNSIMRGGR